MPIGIVTTKDETCASIELISCSDTRKNNAVNTEKGVHFFVDDYRFEDNMRTGIRINTRSSDNRSAEIAANILGDDRGIAVVGFSVDIEALAMIVINSRFNVFERSAEFRVETIEKSSAKGLAKKSVIKMLEALPSGNTSDGDFGNKDVDMRIPLKTAAEGMKNTDETGSKALGFVDFAEHTPS